MTTAREAPSIAGRERAGHTSPHDTGYAVELSIMVAADLAAVAALLLVRPGLFAVGAAAAAVTVWLAQGLYRHRISLAVLDDLPNIAIGVLAGLAAAAAFKQVRGPIHTVWPIAFTGAVLVVGAMVMRAVAYAAIRHQRRTRRIAHRTLIVGAGATAQGLAERIQDHPESGLRLIGSVTGRSGPTCGGLPLLGSLRELSVVIDRYRVTDVVIAYGGASAAHLLDVVRASNHVNATIYVVPRLFELQSTSAEDHIWGIPLIRLRRPAERRLTWRVKRYSDVLMAGMALLAAAPVMLGIALAVRVELGRGIIFRQQRVGRGGRVFDVLKFRSMPNRPPGVQGPWAPTEDSMGRIGRFIRRYSLDELPQLVNVVRGDMSLVGPRPERPEYVAQFTSALPNYKYRHRVPAGLTGLAAVNGLRGDTSILARAEFDNWYIDNWSLWLDVKIMARTVRSVVTGTGG